MTDQRTRPDRNAEDSPLLWEPSLTFLKTSILFILVGEFIFEITLLTIAPDPARVLLNLLLMSVAGAAWFLLARGHIQATVLTLSMGVWSFLTLVSIFAGGANSTVMIIYPLVILLVGWLIGSRAAMVFALLTTMATLCFVLGERWGLLPPPFQTLPQMRWIVQGLVFVFSAVLIHYLVRSYRNRLLELRTVGDELGKRTAETQASEANLRRAQTVGGVGSWVYDLTNDTMSLSAEASRIFGIPEGVMSNHDIYLSHVHPEDRSAVDSAWQVALKVGGAFVSEHRILVGKQIRWVRQRSEVERRPDGTPLRSVGTTQDISERKQAEQAMQESEERYRRLIEQATDGIFLADEQCRVLEVNDTGCRLIGYRRDEVLGKPLASFMDQEALACVPIRFAELNTGKPVLSECRLIRKDGTALQTEINARILPNGQLQGIVRDITERKLAEIQRHQLEAQLRESQKMQAIGTLAGGIAHDFNNIIAIILGNVELMRQNQNADAQALERVERIRLAGVRARDLVKQILSFSRRQPIHREPTALAPVVLESARLLRATLPARLDIEVDCAHDVPPVLADATQVQQALINLATNAMQAMSGTGRIAIRLDTVILDADLARRTPALQVLHARRPGRTARLSVSDNGPGMNPDILDRIFEPFFTTKPAGEGTGLGLSVVHGIVQGHEGVIVVESQPGNGANFALYLPVAAAPAGVSNAATSTTTAPAPRNDRRIQVLYIDDEPELVTAVKLLLEQRGCRVSAYTDPQAALAVLRADPAAFDLVLSDYNMPGMSGLAVAREVRAIRANLPMAVVSGFIDETLLAQFVEAGVRELISKADPVEVYVDVVQRLVQVRQETPPAS